MNAKNTETPVADDNVMMDFFYSGKQEKTSIETAPRFIPPRKYTYKRFDGKPFTCMAIHGEDHGCNFDDMVLVGTGYKSQTEYHTY